MRNQTMLGRYMRSDTDRMTPRIVAPIDQRALATLQDALVSHNFVISSNVINQARFSINRISANPAVTSGFNPRDYGINFANTNPLAAGLPSIAVRASSAAATPRSATRSSRSSIASTTCGRRQRHSPGSTAALDEVRRRHPPRGDAIAFINRPNGDLTFSGGHRQRRGRFPARLCPRRRAPPRQQAIQDGYGWLYAGYVQDEFRVTPRLTLNLGLRYELPTPFIDVNDAITGFRTGEQSQKYPAARRPAWSIPAIPTCPRGIVPTDKNNVAPRLAVAWDPRGDGRTSVRAAVRHVLRRARRPGRLLPERRAVAAVHAAGRAQHADADHAGRSAGRRRRTAESVPAGADDHRLGRRLQVAATRITSTPACSGR